MKYLVLASLLVLASCSSKPKKEMDELGKNVQVSEAGDKNLRGSDKGDIPGLKSVNFEFDQAQLSDKDMNQLIENVNWFKQNPKVKLTLEGHCDDKGSNEYNLALGERRALFVKQILQKKGVPADQISVVSYGEEQPVSDNGTEEGQAKNRRVNFVPQ